MKVILSRKGFDSGYGRCPSPILPDGEMFSLPIPSSQGSRCFGDINYGQHNLGQVVASLTNGRYSSESFTHFDPDLSPKALPRQPGWRSSLGQVGAALTHLHNQNIEVGDLFLFYGWFRDVDVCANGRYQHVGGSKNRHVIFGWLQIGEILDVGSDGAAAVAKKPWLEKHPHVVGAWDQQNKIYIARETLDLPAGITDQTLTGGGTFNKVAASRTLTKSGQDNRSLWALPKFFSPESGLATLTYNVNPDKWSISDDHNEILLDSAKIGQEFVLTVNENKVMVNWLNDIFAS